MTRTLRTVGASIAAVAVLVLASCSSNVSLPSVSANEAAKPNIVFVLTDDLSMNLVSHMSNVLKLEHSGTTMANNYVVDSLCCPSRSAIFTGEFPHDDGVFTNTGTDGGYTSYTSHADAKNSFALSLQKRGYRTAMMGKYLNGYKVTDPVAPGWNVWDVADKGYAEFNYGLNQNGHVHHYGTGAKNYLTNVVSQKASAFIQSSHQPFMLEVATFAPHAPYTPAPKYKGTYHGAYPRTAAYDKLPTNAPAWLASEPPLNAQGTKQITTAWQKRVEAVQSVNDMIGHLEDVLRSTGVAKNTYVVFSSDNGYHMGEYHLLPGKQTAFDTDIHVPLVIAGPHVTAGRTVTQLTSEIDLAPTFETLTGSQVGSSVDGTSIAGILHGADPSHWQQDVLVEHHHDAPKNAADPDAQTPKHADPPSYEAVRTATSLYVKYADGEQEYYDTTRDPLELDNLGGNAAPASIKTALTNLENCHDSAACQRAAGAG